MIRRTVRSINKYFCELDLFEIETTQLEGFNRQVSIIATRIYMVMLTLALIILLCFIALDDQNDTVIVRNPSRSTFLSLDNRFSTTLSCPCRKITISLGSFTLMTASYHPVCDSVFVSDIWINLFSNPNVSFYYALDFRSTATGHFQSLSALCSLAKRFVHDAVDDFLADTFLTQVVLSKVLLDIKIQTLASSMQISTMNSFRQILQLLRSATFSNQLQTALQTSMLQSFYQRNETAVIPVMYEGSFSDGMNTTCRCGAVSTCTSYAAGFFDVFGVSTRGAYISYDSLIANVDGFVAGCYPIESLMQSKLECLFDVSCLSGILKYVPHNNSTHISPLNSSQTQFSSQSTVHALCETLFVEHWGVNVSFDKYYNECAPILCSYTVNRYPRFLYIITQLLSFYGGLIIALRLSIPRIVLAYFKRHRPRRTIWTIFQMPLLEWIRTRIIELNLFRTQHARDDVYELATSRMATRCFLILTCLCIMILAIYTAAMVRSLTMVIHNPSETTFTDLHSKYWNTLKCPCDRIAIGYETFINSTPRYHSLCSSSFIGSAWIDSLSPANWIDEIFDVPDFRVSGQVFFRTLAALCSLTQLTVSNAWFVFKQSYLITEQLLPDIQLNIRSIDALDRFKSDTVTEFKRVLLITQFQISTLLATGTQNFAFSLRNLPNSSELIEFHTRPSVFGNCSCALNDMCLTPMGFFNSSAEIAFNSPSSMYDIPHLFTGCFVIQSVFQSSLQCLFNRTCIDTIQPMLISPKSINMSALRGNRSRFLQEALISELVDELMVEDWGDLIDYSKYYTQCSPKQCSYTINSRSSISYIIAAIIGLCGGVIGGLKVIVPVIVRFLRRRFRPRLDVNLDHSPTLSHRFHQGLQSIVMRISAINLFETELGWDDPERRHFELLTTRIHLFLLAITCSIMIFYTAFNTRIHTTTIDDPSEKRFESLRSNDEFLSTLHCPCQNITIPYQSFAQISFSLHQLCSSDFIRIDSTWMNFWFTAMRTETHAYDDFRMFALLQFRLLVSLCQLANDTLTDSVKRFGTNELITDQAEFRDSIVTKANAVLLQLRRSTARDFVRTLDFTRSITQGNGIVSAILSNWQFVAFHRLYDETVWTLPRSYDDPPNCSCATSSMCTSLATIAGRLVPGFRVGCYVLDSLLQSTLECLYDLHCLEMITGVKSSMNFPMTALDSTLSSPNATVQSLIDDLLIDEWETQVSYDKYYESCAPLFCSYSVNQRADLLYILTACIGFYGGLTTAIKIIAPLIAKVGRSMLLFYRARRVRQNVIVPINS